MSEIRQWTPQQEPRQPGWETDLKSDMEGFWDSRMAVEGPSSLKKHSNIFLHRSEQ